MKKEKTTKSEDKFYQMGIRHSKKKIIEWARKNSFYASSKSRMLYFQDLLDFLEEYEL